MNKLKLSWEIIKNSPGAILEAAVLSSIPFGVLSAAAGGIAYLLKVPEIGKYLEYGALGGVGFGLIAGMFMNATGELESEATPLNNFLGAIEEYREERILRKDKDY